MFQNRKALILIFVILVSSSLVTQQPLIMRIAHASESEEQEESTPSEEEQTSDDPTFAPGEPHPQQEELCDDGIDNDTDGSIDEEDCLPDQQPQEEEPCRVEGCPGQEEVCNDDLDNNADGSVDEGCPPPPLPLPGGPGGGGPPIPGEPGGPADPGDDAGGPSKTLLPYQCVSYEKFPQIPVSQAGFSPSQFSLRTCAEIVEYLNTHTTAD